MKMKIHLEIVTGQLRLRVREIETNFFFKNRKQGIPHQKLNDATNLWLKKINVGNFFSFLSLFDRSSLNPSIEVMR